MKSFCYHVVMMMTVCITQSHHKMTYSRFQFRSNIAYRVLRVVFDPLRNACSNSSIFTCVDCCGVWLSVTRPAHGTHSSRQHKPLFERN